MNTPDRTELLHRSNAELDPVKRETLKLLYALEDLECLVSQIRAGRLSVRLVANYLHDLAAELELPPGRILIRIDDPPVPLSSKPRPGKP